MKQLQNLCVLSLWMTSSGAILESKGVRTIFQKKGKKGQNI